MLLAAISDIHDSVQRLERVLAAIQSSQPDQILCMGDICTPDTLAELACLVQPLPLHIVLGNNDDPWLIAQTAASFPHVRFHGAQGKVLVDNFRIAMVHRPAAAQELARSGRYDAVLHGHDHQAAVRQVGNCILANPGEVTGTRTGRVSYGLLDTTERSFVICPLPLNAS